MRKLKMPKQLNIDISFWNVNPLYIAKDSPFPLGVSQILETGWKH